MNTTLATNTAMLKALGLGHLSNVRSVTLKLTPEQLPTALIEIHPGFDGDEQKVQFERHVFSLADAETTGTFDLNNECRLAASRVRMGTEKAFRLLKNELLREKWNAQASQTKRWDQIENDLKLQQWLCAPLKVEVAA